MKKRRAPGPIICTKDIKESRSSTWCETFTHFSLHVTFYLLLICFCWLLVVSAGYWLFLLVIGCYWLFSAQSLVLFCSLFAAFYSLRVTFLPLLVTFYSFVVCFSTVLVTFSSLFVTFLLLLVIVTFCLLHNFVSWNT